MKNLKKRVLVLLLGMTMILQMVSGSVVFADSDMESQVTQEMMSEGSSSDILTEAESIDEAIAIQEETLPSEVSDQEEMLSQEEQESEEAESQFVTFDLDQLEPTGADPSVMLATSAFPNREAQKLSPVISDIKLQNGVTGKDLVVNSDGSFTILLDQAYQYAISFDLTAYNYNLRNGDYFTLTIPEPIVVTPADITFTDSKSDVAIASGAVTANESGQGGTVTLTLQNLEKYLELTKGETIKDVKGTFYVAFKITEEEAEHTVTFATEETINQIAHDISAKEKPSVDESLVGKTNFEKNVSGFQANEVVSEALGKTFQFTQGWNVRINANQESYGSIVITDTISMDDAPMQFIPETIKLEAGYFASNFHLMDAVTLVQGTDYTIEFKSGYTQMVITISKPSARIATNGNPSAFYLTYQTSVPGDGSEVANKLQMTADEQVLTVRTDRTETEQTVSARPADTSSGTITINTSYSIVLYKVDSETREPLSGAVFKVIMPNGEEIELPATDENGRTQSRQFTSEEANSGKFKVVEVTAPNGYQIDTTPIEVTVGQSGAIRTITNDPIEASGSLALEASKTLYGRKLKADEFSFTVKEGDQIVATGKNDADGKITFSEIEYTRADVGIHTYTISEDAGTENGMTYDSNEYTVTVTVKDNKDGTLSIDAEYPIGGIEFVNSFASTIVEMTKIWIGDPDENASVTFALFANGEETGETLTLTAENAMDIRGWFGIDTDLTIWYGCFGMEFVYDEDGQLVGTAFTGLPMYDEDGKAIEYTVKEVSVEGYRSVTSPHGDILVKSFSPDSNPTGYIVSNIKERSIDVEKKWVGAEKDCVTVVLYADGVAIDTKDITAEDDWKVTFEGLDVYADIDDAFFETLNFKSEDEEESAMERLIDMVANLKPITYTVEELEIDGYDSEVTGDMDEGFVITNTEKPEPEKTSVSVEKKWVGGKETSITARLLADGEEIDQVVLSDENQWTHTFTDLIKFSDGEEIEYTITEDAVEGYETSITEDAETGMITITNTKEPEPEKPVEPEEPKEKTSVTVEKIWVGGKEASVTVRLLADGREVNHAVLNEQNQWTFTFSDLDKQKDGKDIVYTITEDAVQGYTSTVVKDEATGKFTVTNTKNVEKKPVKSTSHRSGAPRTGDHMNIAIMVGGLVGAVAVLVILLARKRKIK